MTADQIEASGRAAPHTPGLMDHLRGPAWLAAAAVASAVAGWFSIAPGVLRTLLAVLVIGTLATCAVTAPRAVVRALVVWLFALGTIRRLLPGLGGGSLDPLLMVEPMILAALVAGVAAKHPVRDRTTLASLVLALQVLLVLSAANPLQGSLATGIAGLLLSMIPTLAFWVGRSLGDDGLVHRILKSYAWLSVAAAAYGLHQILVRLPSWDARWVATRGYAALNVGGTIRAFGTFASPAEYTAFLAIGLIVWITLRNGRWWWLLLPTPLLGYAIFLESQRGTMVTLVVTLCVVTAMRARLPVPAALVAGLLGVAALIWVAGRLPSATSTGKTTSALINHQIGGLANPLDAKTSTLGLHLTYFRDGLLSAFSQPVGRGIGAVTIAGSKFGGSSRGTEFDPSNVAVALGLPGLALYLSVVTTGLRRATQVARSRHDPLSFCALAVLLLTGLQWLNGAMYAVAFLPWLVLGWADRAHLARPVPPQSTPERIDVHIDRLAPPVIRALIRHALPHRRGIRLAHAWTRRRPPDDHVYRASAPPLEKAPSLGTRNSH